MKYRIHPINPTPGFWSFQTPTLLYPQLPVRSLSQNSLVSGIDEMLSEMKEIYGEFDIILSDEIVICDYWSSVLLTWVKGDRENPRDDGNWYRNEAGQIGWLCSVLYDYFSPCPLKLHVYVVKPEGDEIFRMTVRQKIEVFLAGLSTPI